MPVQGQATRCERRQFHIHQLPTNSGSADLEEHMAKKNTAGTAITSSSHRRLSPAGNVVQLSLAELVAAYHLDSKPASGAIEQFRLDALQGGDPGLGDVLLATLAASAPPLLGSDGDGRRRLICNAQTVFALASYTPADSWARTRVRCRVLSEAAVPSSSCKDLKAIFQFLSGTKGQEVGRAGKRSLRQIKLIHRERSCDVARSASVSARRKR